MFKVLKLSLICLLARLAGWLEWHSAGL